MKKTIRTGLILLISVVFVISTCGVSVFGATKLTKPAISSVYVSGSNVTVKAKKYSNINGYQIKYSTSSKFAKGTNKIIKVKTKKKLSKKITGLKWNKKYYFKIRTYKVKNKKTTYSEWSSYRTATTPPKASFTTGYTTKLWTTLHTKKNSKTTIRVWYNTKLTSIRNHSISSTGMWKTVHYYNPNTKTTKTYFVWEDKGDTMFSKTGSARTYKETGIYQSAVLDKALYILNNWNTKYDWTKEHPEGWHNSSNVYPLDCSGFVSYVFNQVMSDYQYSLKTECKQMVAQSGTTVGYDLDGSPIKAKTILPLNSKLTTTNLNKLMPGDVLFFKTGYSNGAIAHVGIYLGGKEFIHSSREYARWPNDTIKVNGETKSRGGVNIAPLTGDYADNFKQAVRFIPEDFGQ